MFCPKCGKEVADGSYACPFCGAVMNDAASTNTAAYEPAPAEEPKVWGIFAKLGFVFGLIGFIGAFIPFLNYATIEIAIAGLIFSIIAKNKSKIYFAKAKKGFTFSLLGIILGIVFAIVWTLLIGLIAGLAAIVAEEGSILVALAL